MRPQAAPLYLRPVDQSGCAAAIEEAEFAAEIAAGAEPIPGAPLAPEPTMDEVLEEGISRLHERSTWKLWQWPLASKEFTDADSFR